MQFRVTRNHNTVKKTAGNERSLGFLPLLLMSIVYLICTMFADDIGKITSVPGFYRLDRAPPRRGCIIPTPSM